MNPSPSERGNTLMPPACTESELCLSITVGAFRQLMAYRDMGDTEVGGFGIAFDPARPLHIGAFHLPKQECAVASVDLDDDDVADWFGDMAEADFSPDQYQRVWWHTHPNIGATPSGADEQTFQEVLGRGPWGVMLILAKGGEITCRLTYFGGEGLPDLSMTLPVRIDWSGEPDPEWKALYEKNVSKKTYSYSYKYSDGKAISNDERGRDWKNSPLWDYDLRDEDDWRKHREDWSSQRFLHGQPDEKPEVDGNRRIVLPDEITDELVEELSPKDAEEARETGRLPDSNDPHNYHFD